MRDVKAPASLILLSGSPVGRAWTRLIFVGLIEYSERTLGVLMLRLKGLFNSAYRHRKTHVSAVLLRLQFGGGVEADRGLFLQSTSASSTWLRPDRRLNSQFDICILGKARAASLGWRTL